MAAPMLLFEDVVVSTSRRGSGGPATPIAFESAVAGRTPVSPARPVDVWAAIPADATDPVADDAALAAWHRAARAWRPAAGGVACCAPVRALRADSSFRVIRAADGDGPDVVVACHWPGRGLAMLGVVPRARAAHGAVLHFDAFDAPPVALVEIVAPAPKAPEHSAGPLGWLLALIDPARPALAPPDESWPAERLHAAIRRYVQSVQAGADPALEHAAPFVYLHGLSRAASTAFGDRELAAWSALAARTPGLFTRLVGPAAAERGVPATSLYLEGAAVERGRVRVPPERAGEAAAAIVVELLREIRARVGAYAAAGRLEAPATAVFITSIWDTLILKAHEQLIDIEDLGRNFATLMPPCMAQIYANLADHKAHPKFAQRNALVGYYVGLGIPPEPIVKAWKPHYEVTDPRFTLNWAGVETDIRELHRKQITCGTCLKLRERGLCPTDDVAFRPAGLAPAEARLVTLAGNAFRRAELADLEAAEAAGLAGVVAAARGLIGNCEDRGAFRRAMHEYGLTPLVLDWLAAAVPNDLHRVRCATLLFLRARGDMNQKKGISAPLSFTKIMLVARQRAARKDSDPKLAAAENRDKRLSTTPLQGLRGLPDLIRE